MVCKLETDLDAHLSLNLDFVVTIYSFVVQNYKSEKHNQLLV